jgi:hypothetical protein
VQKVCPPSAFELFVLGMLFGAAGCKPGGPGKSTPAFDTGMRVGGILIDRLLAPAEAAALTKP